MERNDIIIEAEKIRQEMLRRSKKSKIEVGDIDLELLTKFITLEYKNFNVQSVSYFDYTNGKGLLGMMIRHANKATFVIRGKDHYVFFRILAHYFLKHQIKSPLFNDYDVEELNTLGEIPPEINDLILDEEYLELLKEADLFALSVLMPLEVFEKMAKKYKHDRKIAKYFNVPIELVEKRRNSLL